MEDYYDDVEMLGGRLKIGFHDNRGASKQILIIPFREGRMSGISWFRGVREGDRRVIRCDMVKVMDWDRLIEYLGDVWDEMWDAMLFKLKAAEASMP